MRSEQETAAASLRTWPQMQRHALLQPDPSNLSTSLLSAPPPLSSHPSRSPATSQHARRTEPCRAEPCRTGRAGRAWSRVTDQQRVIRSPARPAAAGRPAAGTAEGGSGAPHARWPTAAQPERIQRGPIQDPGNKLRHGLNQGPGLVNRLRCRCDGREV